MAESLQRLEDILGVRFQRKELLLKAVTHCSFLNEHPEARALGHNERMEFLGDAVLELVVTEYLYRNLLETDEGDMTNMRAGLVCTISLGKVAEELGVTSYVRMSRGQNKDFGISSKIQTRILANAMEAIIAAIYLDRGKATAEIFVLETVVPRLEQIQRDGAKDWKTRLQEHVQELGCQYPTYEILSQTGPAHNVTFTVSVIVGGKTLANASGKSLKEAETEAAKKAYAIFSSGR